MTKPFKHEPRSYVVRVYRHTARGIAGYVEDVQSGRARPFQSAAELWSAIGGPKPPIDNDRAASPRNPNPTREES